MITDFALKEEPVDVEKMRKCLLKQVQALLPLCAWRPRAAPDCSVPDCASVLQLERAEVRLEGIDTILKLATRNSLLPSVQYAMFCGWQRLIPQGIDIG